MSARLAAGFSARTAEANAPAAIRALVEDCQIAEFGSPDEAMIEGILMTRDKPGFVPRRDAWMVTRASGGPLAAYGHLGTADRRHLYAHIYVHPTCAGRGLGMWLLRQIEARERERSATSSTAAEAVTLEQWLAASNQAAHSLLAAAGYAAARHLWGMVIALAGQPSPPIWPDGVSVRVCQGAADLRRAYAATEEAFQDHWHAEARTYEQFIAGTTPELFDPSLWFLATAGDEVIGTALCEAYPSRGWVNSLGVRRPWRRRGIAIALLRQVFAEFTRRGLREVALGVDAENPTGATRVYQRAGMTIERQYDIFEKVLRGYIR
ncbi:MAG: GNAT family N-acetyltransferase [Ktedonobacterales bacterium]